MRKAAINQPRIQPRIETPLSLHARRSLALLLAVLVLGFASAFATQTASQKDSDYHQKPLSRAHKRSAAVRAQASTAQPAPPQEQLAPKPPDWPVNDQPAEAKVEWNSRGLRIEAANSSLQQILKDVATATGAKVSGLGADQRIFGTYGPGAARDVLSQLLDGSGYNVLMIGDRGQGTPRQIVLSKPPTGPAPAVASNLGMNNDDSGSADVEEPPQPQPPPPPLQPHQNMPNGLGPGAQPHTPQQLLQEMQQRQQRIEQMQQQTTTPQ